MARLFDDGLSEYLEIDSAAVTSEPYTLAGWFYTDDDASDQVILAIADKDADDEYTLLSADGAFEGDLVKLIVRDAGDTDTLRSTAGWTVNTWHHACGVVDGGLSCYLDGGNKGNKALTTTPAGWDRTSIGRLGDSTPGRYMSGCIAEAAIWNVALTDAEVAVLGKGYSPLFVRPQNLIAYWPLIRDTDDDIVGAYSMTPYNAPSIADHPPIIYPGRMLLGVPLPSGLALPILSGDDIYSLAFGRIIVR